MRKPRSFATPVRVVTALFVVIAVAALAPRLVYRGGQLFLGAASQASATSAPVSPPGVWRNMFPLWNGNKRLPAHPALAPFSQQMMDTLYADAPTITGPGLPDDSESYWTAKSTDPRHTIHCTNNWGPNNGPCFLEGKQIYVPDGALPAENTDHHTSILQPDGCTVDEMWLTGDMSGPTITAAFAAEHNVCTENGFNAHGGAGTTVGGASNRLGHSPLEELRTGVIHHAIIAFAACAPMDAYVGQALYPGHLQRCRPGVNGIGVPMGAYFWSDVTPDALPSNLDRATRMLCVALNQYGALNNDTNANWNGISLGAFWAGNGRADEYPHGPRTNDDPDGYAAWFAENAGLDGRTNPSACFPNGDWSHHIHVLAW